MFWFRRLLVAVFIAMPVPAAEQPAADPLAADAARSFAEVAIPLRTTEPGGPRDDLQPLRRIVGGARLVTLGEASHGTREFFRLKHRIFEYLVSEMGFTVFAIEGPLPEAFDLNEYVLTGKGDPRKALSALYYWAWNTEEVLEMIEWMRRWNADPAHWKKLKFYGFDMSQPVRAAKVTFEYLERVEHQNESFGDLDLLANPMTSADFDGLPQERKDAALASARELVQRFEDRKKGYVKGSSAAAWAIARQHARILAQYVASRVNDPDRSARSRFMAENIRWILEHEGAGTRMVAWAHNNHVANDGASMGAHLRKALGREMVIFGFAFNEGAFQAIQPGEGLRSFTVPPAPEYTFDALIARAKKPVAMIDFRALAPESAPAKWLREPRVTRDIGGTYRDADQEKILVARKLADRYDILLFVERTSAARANPEAKVVSKIPRFSSPANAGFEETNEDSTPRDWIVLPPTPQKFDFEMLAVETEPNSGKRAGLIRRKPGRHYGEASGSLLQWVDAKPYREKDVRIRLAARKRQEGARMFYWMKVWGAFEERHEVASGEWHTYEIVRAIPANAVVIEYGIALTGDGEAWVDDVELEMVEKTAAPPGEQN